MKIMDILLFISDHPWTSIFVALVLLSVLDCIKDTIVGIANPRHIIEIKRDNKEKDDGMDSKSL